MSNSITKPAKPKDSPLFPHASGRWAKKIRGKFHYFGPWDDYDAALNKWLDEKDELLAGRKPRAKTAAGLTVKDLANRFLAVKKTQRDDGELSFSSFYAYYRACELILRTFGKNRLVADLQSEDFEAMRSSAFKGLAISTRSVTMQLVRTIFKFAYDNDIIEKPVKFGTAFKAASAKSRQKDRTAKKEARILTAEQVRALIDGAGVYLRAMILLGVNCGFGNNDCGTLTFSALDLDGGWHNHARPKTGVPRRAKLWPETVERASQGDCGAANTEGHRRRRSGLHHAERPIMGSLVKAE